MKEDGGELVGGGERGEGTMGGRMCFFRVVGGEGEGDGKDPELYSQASVYNHRHSHNRYSPIYFYSLKSTAPPNYIHSNALGIH